MSTATMVERAAGAQTYREDYCEKSLHLITTLQESSQNLFIRSGMNCLTNLH